MNEKISFTVENDNKYLIYEVSNEGINEQMVALSEAGNVEYLVDGYFTLTEKITGEYNITDYLPIMETVSEEPGRDEVFHLLKIVVSELIEMKVNFICESDVILKKEYIYLDKNNDNIRFLGSPRIQDNSNSVANLIEDILETTTWKKDEVKSYLNDIAMIINKQGVGLGDILSGLERILENPVEHFEVKEKVPPVVEKTVQETEPVTQVAEVVAESEASSVPTAPAVPPVEPSAPVPPVEPSVPVPPVEPSAPVPQVEPSVPVPPVEPAVPVPPVESSAPVPQVEPSAPVPPVEPSAPVPPVEPSVPVPPVEPAVPVPPVEPSAPVPLAEPSAPVAPVVPEVPAMPTAPKITAVPVAPVTPAAPVLPVQEAPGGQNTYQQDYYEGSIGETTVLSAIGETTVLGVGMQNTVIPILVRIKNGEKAYINKPVYFIGKDPARVDYCIFDNSAVSRVHAKIETRNGEFYLIDNFSTNHVYLNGVLLNPNTPVVLTHGARVRLGDEEFEFKFQ